MPIITPDPEKKLLESSHGPSPPGRDPAEGLGVAAERCRFRAGRILQTNSFYQKDGQRLAKQRHLLKITN